jgi:hypothetical protein
MKNSNGDFSGDQFYSSITVNPHGQIFVNFYDAWLDQDNTRVHYVICSSQDGAHSFGETTRITSAATDFTTVGSQNAGFGIGEYNQTLSTQGHVIPVWTDGRTQDGELNIYAAFLETKNGTVGKKEIIPVSEHMSITSIYPNPVHDVLNIDMLLRRNTDISLSIYASDARLVHRKEWKKMSPGNFQIHADTKDLVQGLYLLHIQSSFGNYSTEFIKK